MHIVTSTLLLVVQVVSSYCCGASTLFFSLSLSFSFDDAANSKYGLVIKRFRLRAM
jgi:hypothetical protein